jgi:chlorobactene glucosyltransferase
MSAAWLLAVLPLVACAITAANLWLWPAARRGGAALRVSVLVPARNEEATIEANVRAALSEPVAEVVVLDDRSTDATAAILASIHDPRLRVVSGRPLAPGWVGKAHACARLAEEAREDHLLFVDADTVLRPGALAGLAELHTRFRADVVTAFPHQVLGSAAEAWLLPLLHVTYMSWLPLSLVHQSQREAFLAANGQVLSISKRALAQAGGFEAIRAEVVDDMALCRNSKRAGLRVVFADGSSLADCRMYRSGRELWEGFAKNLYEGLGSPVLFGFVALIYLAAFVVPWLGLALAVAWPSLWGPVLVGVSANLVQRAMIAWRFHQPWWPIMLHAPAVVALLVLGVDSYRRSRAGRITWKGRTYVARDARGG